MPPFRHCPFSGAQEGALCYPCSSGPCGTTAAPVLQKCPAPLQLLLEAPLPPPLCRLGPRVVELESKLGVSFQKVGSRSRFFEFEQFMGWIQNPKKSSDSTTLLGPTCPNCHSTDHMVARLFSCPTHTTELTRGLCGWQPSR